jgi:hypothetical protein
MFADFPPSTDFTTKSATKLSKIINSASTRQSPTFVINLTKIGSTLSPEERQLLECH